MIRLDVDVSQFDDNDEKALLTCLEKISHVGNPVIAELGCWAGHSTSIICSFLKKQGGGLVYSINSFKGCETTKLDELARTNDIKSIFLNNIKELGFEQYSRLCESSTIDAAPLFSDKSFDLIFIDADHRYAGIRSDIDLWLPKLKEGGVICGHDFNSFEYDEKYIHEDCIDWVHHGVTKAVLESFQAVQVYGSVWSAKREDAIIYCSK